MTPKEKKYLTYGGYTAVAGIALWLIFRDPESGGGAVDPTGNGGVNPGGSNVPFSASDKATKLYDLMKEMGSDEKKIMAVFIGVSESQFAQIRTAFGKRSFNKQLGNQVNFSPFWPLPLLPIEEWLERKLSESEFGTLQKKYPNYL